MDTPVNISNSETKKFFNSSPGRKGSGGNNGLYQYFFDKEVTDRVEASKKEITLWRGEMNNVFATKDDYSKFETKLIRRVSRAEGTLILWSFVFWFTLIIAIIVIFKLIK